MRYGYARVSTAKQDYAIQVDALKAAGCETIFTEKVSGKSTDNRTEFKRLMRALRPGDIVVVTKLDPGAFQPGPLEYPPRPRGRRLRLR